MPRATFDYIGSLEWIRAKENLVLVGPAGTGKSHLLLAAGLAAVERAFRVRYFAAAALAETLDWGLADNSVGRLIESLLRADLVIVDDLGFAPLDDTGAQLLFRFVAAAYERRSLGVASHSPFESWGALPARAHDRGRAPRSAPAPQRRRRHVGRLAADEEGAGERRRVIDDALITRPRVGTSRGHRRGLLHGR